MGRSVLAVSLVLLGLLWPLARVARWLALVLVVLLVLLQYANYETVVALGAVVSLADARYLGDRTFFFGSVAAASHPMLLGAVVLASVALAWPGLRGVGAPASLAALAAGGLLVMGLAAWPDDPQLASWRQLDVLEQNALAELEGQVLDGKHPDKVAGIGASRDSPTVLEWAPPVMVTAGWPHR